VGNHPALRAPLLVKEGNLKVATLKAWVGKWESGKVGRWEFPLFKGGFRGILILSRVKN